MMGRARQRRWWRGGGAGAGGGAVLIGLCLGLALACNRDQPSGGAPSDTPAADELPDQQISEFVLRETEASRLAWVLQARSALIYDKRNEIRADSLTVDFYDPEGAISSVLTADHGTIHQRTNAMAARGHVVVRARDGRTLETESLNYAPRRGKIFTDAFVRIVEGRNVLTGYGLESDPDLRAGSFEIKRDVEATVLDGLDVEDGASSTGGG